MSAFDFSKIKEPILLKGDESCAFRDPAVVLHDGIFYLFCTYVENLSDGAYLYTVMSKSSDLINWSEPVKLTIKDKSKNFSSPGNVFFYKGQWHLCLQTYCRENGEKYGNENSRIWLMKSTDLEHWGEAELIRVKGDEIPDGEMGRMIDPYIIKDKDEAGKWWCFYKQNGVSFSCSYDLKHWEYIGKTQSGENVSVIVRDNNYIIFHSPENGIGMLKSNDLRHFEKYGELITLNQKNWSWAKGRLTAGFVLDLINDENYKKYILFYHGSGPYDESISFDNNASIGIAWSDDLIKWEYPC